MTIRRDSPELTEILEFLLPVGGGSLHVTLIRWFS